MRCFLALWLALTPSLAWASGNFQGLGAVLLAIFVGGPVAGLLLILTVVFRFVAARPRVGPRWVRVARVLRWLGPLTAVGLVVPVWLMTQGDSAAETSALIATVVLGALGWAVFAAGGRVVREHAG